MLRDVQRLAGVSNSAAYRHYADRAALLAAVTEYAESRLGDAMLARSTAVPDQGPTDKRAIARFRATGQAYIDFALAEPGLFRTAFARIGVATSPYTPSDPAKDEVPEHHPFQILIRSIDDLVAAGVLSPDRRDGLDEAAWAAVHGLSTLVPRRPAGPGRRRAQTTDHRPPARCDQTRAPLTYAPC